MEIKYWRAPRTKGNQLLFRLSMGIGAKLGSPGTEEIRINNESEEVYQRDAAEWGIGAGKQGAQDEAMRMSCVWARRQQKANAHGIHSEHKTEQTIISVESIN